MIIESTAMPIPRTSAAIPVRVRTPPTRLNTMNTSNAYTNKHTLAITPLNLYLISNIIIINANVIIPAIPVLLIVSLPNDGETLLGVASSVNLVGKLPLLIKSIKFSAVSLVKFPSITTELLFNGSLTLAADIHFLFSSLPHVDFDFSYESVFSSKSSHIAITFSPDGFFDTVLVAS